MMLGKRFVVYLSIPYSAVSFGIMQYDFAGVFTRKHVPRDHRVSSSCFLCSRPTISEALTIRLFKARLSGIPTLVCQVVGVEALSSETTFARSRHHAESQPSTGDWDHWHG